MTNKPNSEKAETSSDANSEIIRGAGGRFIKTSGKPKGVKHRAPRHKAPRTHNVTRPKTYIDIASEILTKASEDHLKEIVENVTTKAKDDPALGLNFAKLCAPAVQRKFVPAGAERLHEVPFVDRPEIIMRLTAERVLDIDSANFFLNAHKLQMELGFTKTLRLALDKYNRGEIDMQAMLTTLGDALLAHEAETIDADGDEDE